MRSDGQEGGPDLGRFALETLEFCRVLALLRPHVASPLGEEWVERCRPLPTLAEAERALAELREMADLVGAGARVPLQGFLECRRWLQALDAGGALPGPRELGDLLAFLVACDRVRLFLKTHEAEHPALGRLGLELPDLSGLRAELERVLDERGEIHDAASIRLASLRADLEEARHRLEAVLRRLLADRRVTRYLQSTQVAWRGGRPVLQVKAEFQRRVAGILHDRSQSGQTAFVEPQEVVAQANRVADLRGEEAAEVGRILAELIRSTASRREEIFRAAALLGRIDFVHAKVLWSRRLGLAVPELVRSWPLRIRGMRHPLLVELRLAAAEDPATVVPLDLTLGDDHDCLVVTGPNTGGKTVALKGVGLTAVMALAGLPVPATAAWIPFLDGVFADIGDEQEISQSLSTFSSHIRRIVHLLREATERSLVLLDELGAGTDPAEGGVLGYAILEVLLRRQARTLATTHLGVLKTFALHHPRAQNGAMEFDPETLLPRYRLFIGLPGTSNALAIARRAGMPGGVVDRAAALLARPDQGLESLVEKLQETRVAAEESRRKAEEMEAAAAARAAAMAGAEKELALRERILEEAAGRQAELALRRAREELARLLQPLLAGPAAQAVRAREVAAAVEALLAWSPLAEQRRAFLDGLRRGDTVRVPRFRFRGPVERIHHQRGTVTVLLEGGLRMEVPFVDVVPDDAPPGHRPSGG